MKVKQIFSFFLEKHFAEQYDSSKDGMILKMEPVVGSLGMDMKSDLEKDVLHGDHFALHVWLWSLCDTCGIPVTKEMEQEIYEITKEKDFINVKEKGSDFVLRDLITASTYLKTNKEALLACEPLAIPWIPSEMFVSIQCVETLIKLCIINLALGMEIGCLPVNFVSGATGNDASSRSVLCHQICWLLNDSKVVRESSSMVSCFSKSIDTLNVLITLVEPMLKNVLNDFEYGRKKFCGVSNICLGNTSWIYITTLMHVLEQICLNAEERLIHVIFPTIKKRITDISPQKAMPVPENVPLELDSQNLPFSLGLNSSNVQVFEEAFFLKKEAIDLFFKTFHSNHFTCETQTLKNVCQRGVFYMNELLSMEFLLNLIVLKDLQIDYFNKAMQRILLKKKPTTLLPPIGQPLQKIFLQFGDYFSNCQTISSLYEKKNALCGLAILSFETLFNQILTIENKVARRPKIAKGCVDQTPAQMFLRQFVIDKIQKIFLRYGAVPIDTPIFELKETLLGKYGDNQKLIFDLNDQGGEQLSLRYDLTIPFARYTATHSLEKIKRYHIGKVYRRDEPQVHHGRFREFYQCDLDIAGKYDMMVPDVEVLCVLWDILNEFKQTIGDFLIKVNHRKLLDAILDICGINEDNFKSVCSSIDKLDKIGWKGVQQELITTKNVPLAVTEKLEKFIAIHGSFDYVMEEIEKNVDLKNHSLAIKAIEELKLIKTYLLDTNYLSALHLDLSLARGLDYYTGMIFEAIVPAYSWIGSVGAGGRYDGLLKLFSAKEIPSVGVSVGLERLFRLLEYNLDTKGILKKKTLPLDKKQSILCKVFETHVDVLVCSVSANLQRQKIYVCQQLRHAGICCDFIYTNKMKLGKQLQQANEMGVELVIVIGEEEIKQNMVMLKRFHYTEETDQSRQVTDIQVPLINLVEIVQTYLHTTCAKRMEHVILGK